MTSRLLLAALVLAATASPALAQKPDERGSSEQASGDARGAAAMGWYKIATESGSEMVQAIELQIETMAGGESSLLTLDGKTGEIGLLREISFHGLGGRPDDGDGPLFGDGAPMAYDSSSSSSETKNNPDGSTTKTKTTTTTKTNPDGSTTTTVSSSSTTTHPDGSTEDTDVVVVRTSPPTTR